jgi:glyoxylase-like metal-dependent hydrolase (beta-lactamase superfamily II)
MNKGLRPVAILLTHAHNDHFDGVDGLRKRYGDLPVYIGELETDLLADGTLNNPFGDSEGLTADHTVRDGQILELAGLTLKVIHTPGHTAGSVCYYFEQEKILVAGDTLFFRSYGRTDLATGSDQDMFDSLAKLLTGLPEDVQVLPGHGRTTTIGYEKAVKGFE